MYLRSLQKEIIKQFDLHANNRSEAHRQTVRAIHRHIQSCNSQQGSKAMKKMEKNVELFHFVW